MLFHWMLASILTADCWNWTTNTSGACGPGFDQCEPPGYDEENLPMFHIRDHSCAENDPTAPFYDEVHGVYHYFFADHPQQRRVKRHAVSRDFIHWAYLPIPFWNGPEDYDAAAIYTGSMTVVHGKPVWVYPGLCHQGKGGMPNCKTGTNLAIATPANASDPLYTYWVKAAYNPIVENVQRDPSTAWQDPTTLEWRLTTYSGGSYNSMDFKNWHDAGPTPGFGKAECPSFFPLPQQQQQQQSSTRSPTPTHVYKNSHGGRDWMQAGVYTSGAINTSGHFAPAMPFQLIDAGLFYASKDMYDPVKKRRINWGWAKVPAKSSQTLPREVTWHPELQQLVFAPVAEQDALRGNLLANISSSKTVPPNATLPLTGSGNQSEVEVVFARPSTATRLSVIVDGGYKRGPFIHPSPTEFYIEYDPTSPNATVGYFTAPPSNDTAAASVDADDAAAGADSVGKYTCANPQKGVCLTASKVYKEIDNTTDIGACCSMCEGDQKCVSWNINLQRKICFLRPDYITNKSPNCISGKVRSGPPGPPPSPPTPKGASATATLQLLPSDTTITLRIYIDGTFSEAYWQGGRVAMTVATQTRPGGNTMVTVRAGSGGAVVKRAQAWQVNSIWITADEVLAMPRPDGKPTIPKGAARTDMPAVLSASALALALEPNSPPAPPPLSSRALWVWSGGASPLINKSTSDAFFGWAATQDIPISTALLEDEGLARDDPSAAIASTKAFALEAASKGMGVQTLYGWNPSEGSFPNTSALKFVDATIALANDVARELHAASSAVAGAGTGAAASSLLVSRGGAGITGISFDIEPRSSAPESYQQYADFLPLVRQRLDSANVNRIVRAAAAAAATAAADNVNDNGDADGDSSNSSSSMPVSTSTTPLPPQNLTLSIAGSWGYDTQNVSCGALGVVSMLTCTVAYVDTYILMNYRNNAYGCYCRPPPGKNPPTLQCPANGGPIAANCSSSSTAIDGMIGKAVAAATAVKASSNPRARLSLGVETSCFNPSSDHADYKYQYKLSFCNTSPAYMNKQMRETEAGLDALGLYNGVMDAKMPWAVEDYKALQKLEAQHARTQHPTLA